MYTTITILVNDEVIEEKGLYLDLATAKEKQRQRLDREPTIKAIMLVGLHPNDRHILTRDN